jgi:hypothetical protein
MAQIVVEPVQVAEPVKPDNLQLEDSDDELEIPTYPAETLHIPDQKQARAIRNGNSKRNRALSPTPQDAPGLMQFSPQPMVLNSPRVNLGQTSKGATLSKKLGRLISPKKTPEVEDNSSPEAGAIEEVPNLAASPQLGRFQSTWKFDEAGMLNFAGNTEKVESRNVDVIDYIKIGSVLLKFGMRGSPHFRFFAVNSKLDTLLWMSGSKRMEVTQIPVMNICDIKFGLGDKALRIKGSKQYQDLGFTIVYDDYSRTLELLAKDAEELQIWVTALVVLHNACKEKKPAPIDWIIPISAFSAKRQIIFGKNDKESELSERETKKRAEDARRKLPKLSKKFEKISAELERVVVPFVDEMIVRTRSLIKSSESPNADLSYLVWNLELHLEAITKMMETPTLSTPY